MGRGDVQGRAASRGGMLLFAATAAAVKRRRVLVQSAKGRVLPVTSLFQKGRLGALRLQDYEYSSMCCMKYAVSKRIDLSKTTWPQVVSYCLERLTNILIIVVKHVTYVPPLATKGEFLGHKTCGQRGHKTFSNSLKYCKV